MKRVLIVDGKPRARRSLRALLTAVHWSPVSGETPAGDQVEIVDEASDGLTAIEKVELLRPDAVVMELHPELDGLAVIATIRRRWPEVRIVVLTMYAKDRAAALEAGADAFLLKGCSTHELLAAFLPDGGSSRQVSPCH